jgi:fatty acid desaturase
MASTSYLLSRASVLLRLAVILVLLGSLSLTPLLAMATVTIGDREHAERVFNVILSYAAIDLAVLLLLGALWTLGRLHARHWAWLIAAMVAAAPVLWVAL